MQTRKPGLRALTLALAGVLTLGLAACEETKTVTPATPTDLTISPSGTVDLQVGDQIAVVANLTNAPAGATVTWASSNSAVASVDGNGTVTAVAPGIATITASANGNQGTVRQALAVRVTGDTELPPDSAQVLIEGLVDGDNDPVDTDDVEGTIFVRMDVTRGAADSLHVLVGDDVVCRQTFTLSASKLDGTEASASLAQAEFVCPINTLSVNADGTPRFANGATTITAQLINDGAVIATATRAITLDNDDAVTATITADTTAIGDSGLRWNGGDVTVDVSPVIFSTGAVSRVTVTAYDDADGDGVVDAGETLDTQTDTAAPFSIVFEADDLGEVTAETLRFRLVTVTAAGNEGPTSTTAAIRYDNEGPVEAEVDVDAIEWFNERTFASLVDFDEDDVDAGVGDVEINFFAIDADDADDAEEVIEDGEEVTSGADLDETNTSTDYALAVQACDALGNCTIIGGIDEFGVDLGDPVIDEVEILGGYGEDDLINATDIDVSIEDEVSGPADQPLWVSAIGMNADDSEFCAIGDPDDDCAPDDAVDVDFTALDDEDAYYTITITAMDQAGNLSDPETITILLDTTDPVVEDLDYSVTIEPGDEAEFDLAVSDNVDLANAQLGFDFAGAPAPFTTIIAHNEDLGDFGAPLTEEEELTIEATYLGALYTEVDNTWRTVSAIVGMATDVAGLTGEEAGTAVNAAEAAATLPASYTSFAVTEVDGNATEPADELEGSVAIEAVIEIADEEAAVPFAQVNFFIYGDFDDDGDSEVRFIGTDASASQLTSATDRTFTYSANLDTTEYADGAYTVFAVGLQADGDAIATEEFTIDILNED